MCSFDAAILLAYLLSSPLLFTQTLTRHTMLHQAEHDCVLFRNSTLDINCAPLLQEECLEQYRAREEAGNRLVVRLARLSLLSSDDLMPSRLQAKREKGS